MPPVIQGGIFPLKSLASGPRSRIIIRGSGPLVKGRAFGSPLARGLKPRASTAEIPPGFAVLIREAMRAGKPGVSLPFTKRLSQGGAFVAVKMRAESSQDFGTTTTV